MKQKLTIEVDVPDGFEAIDWRVPDVKKDWWLAEPVGTVVSPHIGMWRAPRTPRVIVRPIWTPPEWLKPGWIAMNAEGGWTWHSEEPHQRAGHYWGGPGDMCSLHCLNWTPPPRADWKESKREIKAPTC